MTLPFLMRNKKEYFPCFQKRDALFPGSAHLSIFTGTSQDVIRFHAVPSPFHQALCRGT
jgi:hypothetical protein